MDPNWRGTEQSRIGDILAFPFTHQRVPCVLLFDYKLRLLRREFKNCGDYFDKRRSVCGDVTGEILKIKNDIVGLNMHPVVRLGRNYAHEVSVSQRN